MSRLNQLRTFLEAYRSLTLSKAAQQLGISQPTATGHIQSLESLIGKPLFIRRPNGIEPTDTAHELARTISPNIDALELKLASFRPNSEQKPTIHLATPADIADYCLSQWLAPLLKQGYRFRLHLGGKDQLYQKLANQEVDFAITASTPQHSDYASATLFHEHYGLVYSPTFAQQYQLTQPPRAEQLAQLPLIAYDEHLPLIRQWWQQQYGHRPHLHAALTIADLRSIKSLVLAHQGWSVLSDYQYQQDVQQHRLIAHPQPQGNPIYLVWHAQRPLSPARQAVKQQLIHLAQTTFPNTQAI
ncbi:LysR family transcriptional regulator [Avibacterium paragallinarum]|uniref:LysR family transcriptional regulator n=1 Tax=Avibacterium paragallinarum TaxID=728 RepID=UPI0039791BD9